MKKNLMYLFVAVLTMSMALCSCGSKKTTGNKFDEDVELKLPSAEKAALEKPALRSVGYATQMDLNFATQAAAANARNAFAQKIKTTISSCFEGNDYSYMQAAASENDGTYAQDAEQKQQAWVEAIVKEMPVTNTAIIDKNVFKQKNGQYRVFVCVEFQGSIAELAADMATGYKKAVEQKIGKEKRAEIDIRADEFREKVLERMAKMD